MSEVLKQVRLVANLANVRIWKPDTSGGFSCKSAFAAIQQVDGLQDFPFHKFIWKSSIPARIKFFAWTLCLEKINTHEVLQKKRPLTCSSPTWCVMCKKDQESIPHLFIQCDFAKFLQIKVFREFGINIEIPNNFLDLLNGCPNAQYTKSVKELQVCVVWAVLWGIWIKRNSRIFRDEYVSVFNLWDNILYWVAIWVKSCKDFKFIPFSELSMGWSFLL